MYEEKVWNVINEPMWGGKGKLKMVPNANKDGWEIDIEMDAGYKIHYSEKFTDAGITQVSNCIMMP